ncbi:hypothetical protein L5515_012380 [Caenorhabditis briggsae]|uniref:Uncharacterized protein n=1 Tax=Caenorhabditis briggsae TaxID=6238 RepID=A0AAE9EWW7_CAEBR|nr:hypothetical protein L5515_012380 [Caenorhabditis briggsae]
MINIIIVIGFPLVSLAFFVSNCTSKKPKSTSSTNRPKVSTAEQKRALTVATPPETPSQITPKPDNNNNINNGKEEENLVKKEAAKPSEAPKEEHLDNKKDESPRKKPKKLSREKIHKNPGAGNDGKKNDGENQEREKEKKEKTKSVKKSTRNDAKSAETLVTPQGDADMDKDGETKTKKTEEQDEKEGGGGKTEMSDAKKEMLKEDDTLRETKSIGKKKKKQEKT